MNRRQKLVQQQFLNNEEAVIKRLEQVYGQALKDIDGKIEKLMKRFDPVTGDLPQSAIYQIQYQKMLKGQIEGILNQMQTNQYLTVSDYLNGCYEDGFIGSLFDLHGQGVPLAMPIDQTKLVRAVQLDSKISQGLYTRLGEDVNLLKKKITAQVSRSISNGTSYAECAKQLSGYTRIGYNNAVRIARTEGHRIQCAATMDTMHNAKERGADVVKQWDATLDGLTRESHVAVDGEIRELDEVFSNGLEYPGDPSGGAAEVVNCRCAILQRARWALGDGFTKWNNFTGEFETFDSPESYDEFKKAFFSPANKDYMNHVQRMEKQYGTKDFRKVLDRMTDEEYAKYSRLLKNNPLFNTSAPAAVMRIEDCKTVAEVESLFKNQGWFQVQTINGVTYDSNEGCTLDGLDLECARSIYTTHEKLFTRYPQLVGKLNGTNTARLSGSTYAQCHVGLGHGGILVNTRYFDNAAKLARMYGRDIASGFHVVGTTYHSIVMHELGHAIDDYLTNALQLAGMRNHSQPKWVSADLRPKVMKACGLKVADASTAVSGYATKDHYEWFAECFCEYMDSDSPRAVATEFGKYFEELMKKVN